VSKPKNDNRSPKKRATAANDNRVSVAAKVASAPWLDVDYTRARDAIAELAAWAFDLAAADVTDWPEGKRRVRNARRYVLARLSGKVIRSTPFEDVIFTAGLLARIFEQDAGLDMSDMVDVFDQLGLPTEVVPIVPRAQPSIRIGALPRVVPIHASRPALVTARPSPCAECGHVPRLRNAA
jgi:hypothetical protein